MGDADAYQRMLRKNRLPAIRKFVGQPSAVLPTNILVHLSDKVTVDKVDLANIRDVSNKPITLSRAQDCDVVTLNIPMEYASTELIDGQHRLYGFCNADDATKKGFNLVVLGVKGLGETQRRDTFVAINDNSRRMDANLVAYLKYTTDDFLCQKNNELMAIRVVVDLNKQTPFKKAIKLLDVGHQTITLKGFAGYDLRGLLGSRGLLRKYYPSNNPSEYTKVLRVYFSTIQELFKTEWNNPRTYIIATNRGISAFLKLFKSILKTHNGPIDHEVCKKYLSPLRAPTVTWEFARLKSRYVGAQGWKQFHSELVSIIKNEYPDFKE